MPNPFGIRYATHPVTFPCGYLSCLRDGVRPSPFGLGSVRFRSTCYKRLVCGLASIAPLAPSTLDVLLERHALLRGDPAPTELPSEQFPFPVVMCTSAASLRQGYGPWVCLNVLTLRRGVGVWAVSTFGRLTTVYLSALADRGDQAPQKLRKLICDRDGSSRLVTCGADALGASAPRYNKKRTNTAPALH